ncbi:DeoR family transcriptional regulator [Micromonospora sp. NPDC050695]|uniref:DeoR family transcriptional regulator n=1 Tax=Micromonospora sp. NPDC050695 TaxID=3154938 RepID=UPI0033CFBCA1
MVTVTVIEVRSSGGRHQVIGERLLISEWMSVAEAAEILEVSDRTVQRSLKDEAQRAE